MHAFNAHELSVLEARGPLSEEAIKAADGEQEAMIAGWRAALTEVYRT